MGQWPPFTSKSGQIIQNNWYYGSGSDFGYPQSLKGFCAQAKNRRLELLHPALFDNVIKEFTTRAKLHDEIPESTPVLFNLTWRVNFRRVVNASKNTTQFDFEQQQGAIAEVSRWSHTAGWCVDVVPASRCGFPAPLARHLLHPEAKEPKKIRVFNSLIRCKCFGIQKNEENGLLFSTLKNHFVSSTHPFFKGWF